MRLATSLPTNVADEEIIEGQYGQLKKAIDSIPAHNVLIVFGDFNARIGPEDGKFTYHSETNRNGKYVVDLAVEKRKSEKIPRKKHYDWKTVSMDTSLQEKYAVEVRNRFEVLGVEEESATDRYDIFIKANKKAAEKIVPLRDRPKRTRFSSDPGVIKARDEIKDAYVIYQQNTTEGNRAKYKKAKDSLEEVYNLVIEEDLNSKIKEIETAHVSMALAGG